MIVHRIGLLFLVFCNASLLLPQPVAAHGGVVEENDLCVIKVNYLRAHFKIYQPQASGHEQFCEDLPLASESVFVMEYQHDAMSTMPIAFRIIRNVTGKGRFARIEDIAGIEDLDAVTVFFRPETLAPDVYTVIHDFVEEGDFIGVVSARNTESDKVYAAVFPFEVGFTGLGYWPFIVALLVVIQGHYLIMSGRLRRWLGGNGSAAAVTGFCLLLSCPSFADDVVVTYTTPAGSPAVNRMHSWILHVVDESGAAVEGAEIAVTGGMPEHQHGLPTAPRVTEELGGGDYRLDGMRFHMSGYWEIVVTVTTPSGSSTVTIPLQL